LSFDISPYTFVGFVKSTSENQSTGTGKVKIFQISDLEMGHPQKNKCRKSQTASYAQKTPGSAGGKA